VSTAPGIQRDHAKISVFIASPGDVGPERDRIAGVTQELNRTLGAMERVMLDAVRWETHAWPGFGEDAQAVINAQIPPYDIFIGLFWKRLGTQTGRAVSGTVEEFERAYEQWETHQRPSIMFYFNTSPFTPTAEDLEQYQGVLEFKRVLRERGALYWEYGTVDELESLVRQHLFHEIPRLLTADLARRAGGGPDAGDDDAATDEETFDILELRLRLEAKLEYLCTRILGTPSTPVFATIGSLHRDGYLTLDEARLAARIQTLDPGVAFGPSAGDGLAFLTDAERFVNSFRVIVFDALVQKSLPRGWTVETFAQRGKHRPDWLAVKGRRRFRIAPRFYMSSGSKLSKNVLARLARGRDDPPKLEGRIVVVPDVASVRAAQRDGDPRMVKLRDLGEALGG
jgi:hypothetical protein